MESVGHGVNVLLIPGSEGADFLAQPLVLFQPGQLWEVNPLESILVGFQFAGGRPGPAGQGLGIQVLFKPCAQLRTAIGIYSEVVLQLVAQR